MAKQRRMLKSTLRLWNTSTSFVVQRKPFLQPCTTTNVRKKSSYAERVCWKCKCPVAPCGLFCGVTECGVIQHIDQAHCTYFDIFSIPVAFKIDMNTIDLKFKSLQKSLHPDKFTLKSATEIEMSNTNSSLVNQAYQVLCHPVERINYMVERIDFFHHLHFQTTNDAFSYSDVFRHVVCVALIGQLIKIHGLDVLQEGGTYNDPSLMVRAFGF